MNKFYIELETPEAWLFFTFEAQDLIHAAKIANLVAQVYSAGSGRACFLRSITSKGRRSTTYVDFS